MSSFKHDPDGLWGDNQLVPQKLNRRPRKLLRDHSKHFLHCRPFLRPVRLRRGVNKIANIVNYCHVPAAPANAAKFVE